MPERFEDQEWYPRWREALDRVVAALMARDRAQVGTREREAAQRDYDDAMEAFRGIANRLF